VGNLSDGDRVRVVGPKDSEWLEDEGTVAGSERGDPEWAITVQLDDGGRRFFKIEQLEKIE
jgi:hypothetical protein